MDAASKHFTLPKVNDFSRAADIENDRLRHISIDYTGASTICQMQITPHSGWSDSSSEVRNAGSPTALRFFKVWCSNVQS